MTDNRWKIILGIAILGIMIYVGIVLLEGQNKINQRWYEENDVEEEYECMVGVPCFNARTGECDSSFSRWCCPCP